MLIKFYKEEPNFNDFHKLTYALSVFRETLRLHPPVKLSVKVNTKQVKIGNFSFGPNTQIGLYFPVRTGVLMILILCN